MRGAHRDQDLDYFHPVMSSLETYPKEQDNLKTAVYMQRCSTKILFIIAKPGERIHTPSNTIIEK